MRPGIVVVVAAAAAARDTDSDLVHDRLAGYFRARVDSQTETVGRWA